MKTMILSNANSPFIKWFCNTLSEKLENYECDLLTTPNGLFAYPDTVKVHVYPKNGIAAKHPAPLWQNIRRVWGKYKHIKNAEPYDIIHVHYVGKEALMFSKLLRKRCKQLIVSVWGGEFQNGFDPFDPLKKQLYDRADVITFTSAQYKELFDRHYNRRYLHKLKVCPFGLATFEELKKLKLDKNACKRMLGLPLDKKIVSLGYNSTMRQQHLKIIERLEDLDDVFFVVPMTNVPCNAYSQRIQDYIADVRRALVDRKINHKIFLDYMTNHEVAMLRKASDILIQVQIYDQLSASMQEHLYAENIVITGAWLPYEPLYERGVFMLKVHKPEEVGSILRYALHNYDDLKERCKNNPKIIEQFNNPEECVNRWVNLYEKLEARL